MAAGLGFKDFQTGEVLTAGDVDGYLMQGIWVFASAAARDAAVTSPQEGNFAFLKDTNTTTYYTGSAWTNLDTTGMVNPMTTTGDMIYSSSGSTPARLGLGTANQQLRVNAGATAPEWFTPAGGSSGLTKITTLNPSAASEAIADDVFSSTYDNYLIVGYLNQSANANLDMQLRSGGSNLTSTIYRSGWVGATLYGQWFLCDNFGSDKDTAFSITLTQPYLAQAKYGVYQISREGTSPYSTDLQIQDANSRTGFRIYPDSGTITGQIVVYGLAE